MKNTGKVHASVKTFAERVAVIPKDINAIRRGHRLEQEDTKGCPQVKISPAKLSACKGDYAVFSA